MQEPGGLVRSFENTAEGGMRAFDDLGVPVRHSSTSDATEGSSNEPSGHVSMKNDHMVKGAVAIISAPQAFFKIFIANAVANGGTPEDRGVRGEPWAADAAKAHAGATQEAAENPPPRGAQAGAAMPECAKKLPELAEDKGHRGQQDNGDDGYVGQQDVLPSVDTPKTPRCPSVDPAREELGQAGSNIILRG